MRYLLLFFLFFLIFVFQNRANLISAHLDDLKKTLYERGKALGVKPKSAIPIEVSTGTYFCSTCYLNSGRLSYCADDSWFLC